MKKIVTGLLLLKVLIFVSGCQKTDINFGSQFVDNNYTQIIKADTLSVQMDTKFYDSIITGGTGIALAGIYKDPSFGTVTASSYLKLSPPTYNLDSNYSTSTFDSIVLVMKPNGHYYGDTTKPVHLDVFRLAANIQPAFNNISYYNYNTIPQYAGALGGTDFLYYPHNPNSDSCTIRLSDGLGQELFGLMQTNNLNIQNVTSFLTYFYGICISPGPNPSLMLGFSDSVYVRLYFNSPGVINYQDYKDFKFYDNVNQFNNITINRAGTPLGNVTPNVYTLVNSSLTGNAGYMQTATGTAVKISFPYLNNILQIPNFIKVAQATLILKPVVGTYNWPYFLPDSLRLTQTDVYNDMLGDITSSANVSEIGVFTLDYQYGQNTQYAFDVTNYVNLLLSQSVNNGYGLLVNPPQPAFGTRADRAIFDNSANPNVNSQLIVYYITAQ